MDLTGTRAKSSLCASTSRSAASRERSGEWERSWRWEEVGERRRASSIEEARVVCGLLLWFLRFRSLGAGEDMFAAAGVSAPLSQVVTVVLYGRKEVKRGQKHLESLCCGAQTLLSVLRNHRAREARRPYVTNLRRWLKLLTALASLVMCDCRQIT